MLFFKKRRDNNGTKDVSLLFLVQRIISVKTFRLELLNHPCHGCFCVVQLWEAKKANCHQLAFLKVPQTVQISNHFLEDLERLTSLSAETTVMEY